MSSIAKFYELEANKIKADGKKISLFTKHPGTLGGFREARLREYLSEHLGGNLIVSSGFITQHDPDSEEIYNNSSLQVDALVYDSAVVPLLKSTDFVVVDAASVAAVIEVKSNLTLSKQRKIPNNAKKVFSDKEGKFVWGGTLVDALNNVVRSIAVLNASGVPRDSFFTGIISYEASSIGQFEQAMKSGQLPEQLGINNLDDLPHDICIFGGKWFGLSAYKWIDPDHGDPTEGSDKNWAFLLESDGKTSGGSLQLFTAALSHTISFGRSGNPNTVGGLRSAKGFREVINNHKIPVGSPRQHEG